MMVTTALRLMASLRAYVKLAYRSKVAVFTCWVAIIESRDGVPIAARTAIIVKVTMSSIMVRPYEPPRSALLLGSLKRTLGGPTSPDPATPFPTSMHAPRRACDAQFRRGNSLLMPVSPSCSDARACSYSCMLLSLLRRLTFSAHTVHVHPTKC